MLENKNIWLTFYSSWLWLANKKHNVDHAPRRPSEGKEKIGIENKAFEAEESEKKAHNADGNQKVVTKDSVMQSQIEMGILESIVNNSKIQH